MFSVAIYDFGDTSDTNIKNIEETIGTYRVFGVSPKHYQVARSGTLPEHLRSRTTIILLAA
jgi:hypothetical protein